VPETSRNESSELKGSIIRADVPYSHSSWMKPRSFFRPLIRSCTCFFVVLVAVCFTSGPFSAKGALGDAAAEYLTYPSRASLGEVKVATVDLARLLSRPPLGNQDTSEQVRQKTLNLIEEYSTRNGISVTFDTSSQGTSVLYASNSIDITDAITHSGDNHAETGAKKVAVINVISVITSTAEGKQAAAQLQAQFAGKSMKQAGIQDEIDRAQREAVDRIGRKMLEVLGKYATEHQIVLVLDTSSNTTPVMYVDARFDITQIIVGLYDQAHPVADSSISAAHPPVQSDIPILEKVAVSDVRQVIPGTAEGKQASVQLQAQFAGKSPEQAGLQEEINRAQEEVINRIGQKMLKILETYAKDTGTGLILDTSGESAQVVYAAKEIEISQKIIRQYDQTYPAAHPSTTTENRESGAPFAATTVENGTTLPDRGVQPRASQPTVTPEQYGSYYALVIGIDDYRFLPKLKTAVNDAQAVADLLHGQYAFEVNVLRNPTRYQILVALDQYRRTLPTTASLLIYYAGHGAFDQDTDKAYWLPVDAEKDNHANWIIADDITSDARAIPALHVLIISDSCYSGVLTRDIDSSLSLADRGAYVEKMLRSRSRNLMSSGGNEPVADGGRAGHSVFADALLHALVQMDQGVFTAADLFNRFVQPQVAGRSNQVPQYSLIRNSGHEYGDFVFHRLTQP